MLRIQSTHLKQKLLPQPGQLALQLKRQLPIIIKEKTMIIRNWIDNQAQALKVYIVYKMIIWFILI